MDAELDFVDCLLRLERQVVREFPGVTVETQGTSDAMTVAWFGTGVPGEVRVMVTIAFNGEVTVGTGEGLMMELHFPSLDAEEVVARLLAELRVLGAQGVELVRILWPLGPLSPSWVGPARSREVMTAKAHRLARVAASAGPWSRTP